MFKQNKLSTAIVAVLASVAGANQAFAQEDSPAVEEVIVTGIRASVQAAMDIKRDSAGVVDAISAEDIGKFPDTNLAESLQRITGVSIDRTNGEGSRITVRGFGPDRNMVTLNGRTMPGGSTYAGSSGADDASRGGNGRAFDFANLASEAVSSVEVYKTGKASIATGGIGASVNIKTSRPLDNPGFKASVGAKAVMDTTNRTGSDITPELSGIVSWSDESDKFGVSLSASLQERDSGYTGATVNDWNLGYWGTDDLYNLDGGVPGAHVNSPVFGDETVAKPEIGQLYARPNDIRYAFSDSSRTRTNAQLTLQFAPNDQVTATLDYTLAQNELEEHRGEVTNWVQNGSLLTDVRFDGSDIATPTMIVEDYRGSTGNGFRDIGFSQQYRSQENTLGSLGLNVEFAVNDELTLTFDAHDSSMESLPTGPGRSGELDIGLGAPVKQGKSLFWTTSGLPYWSYTFPESEAFANNYSINDCVHQSVREQEIADRLTDANPDNDAAQPGDAFLTNCNQGLDAGDVSSTVMRVWSAEQTTDVTQIKLDGVWEFDEGRFDFGVERSELETNTTTYNGNGNQVLGGWGADNPGEFPEGLIQPFNVASEFDDYSTSGSPGIGFRADARQLGEYLVSAPQYAALLPYVGLENLDVIATDDDGNPILDDDNNPVRVLRNGSSSSSVEEVTTALYLQVALEGQLANFPVRLLTGVRYESTEQTSIGGNPPVDYLSWQSDNDFSVVSVPGATATIAKNDYDALLPSMDLDISLSDSVTARISFSETLSRPNLSELNASVTGVGLNGSTLNSAVPGATGSNPYLRPLTSSNFDLSVEWYFDESSYVSAGFFEKRVKNFTGTEQVNQSLFDIRDQTAGPRATEAFDELADRGLSTDDASLYTMMVILADSVTFPGGADDFTGTPEQIQALGENCQDACDILPNGDDPLMIFEMSVPIDGNDAKIYGAEFAVQHFFGDTGFGVMANYTFVNGDIKFDNLGDPGVSQFALLGLSDTANLVLMYEDYGIQGRLAYNWRDEFLGRTGAGSSNNPGYTEAYAQLDMNVSYEVMDGLSVFFEGINLTGEDRREYARNKRQMWGLDDLGSRYQIGARYSF